MPAVQTKVVVRLDKKALDAQLQGRTSPVGRTLSAFAGLVTQDIKGVFKDQAGGAWWPIESRIDDAGARGTRLTVTVRKTRPHVIRAVNAPALVFNLQDGSLFWGQQVNHPGSTPPEGLILTGIQKAGRRLTFTRAAPTITYPNT